jgi:predicted acylesterase/phospholipase RssA
MCEKFRSYKSRETSTNPTIIEAIKATCAIPTLFTPVSIESVGCQVSYVTGAYNFNNPAWETIKEACESFGQRQLVACMLSLGCGQRPVARLSQKHGEMAMDLISDIASDGELVDRDLSWRIGKSNVYYRLSVDRILKSDGTSALGLTEDITSCTKVFLEHADTVDKVDRCTKASECLGRVTLTDIGQSFCSSLYPMLILS